MRKLLGQEREDFFNASYWSEQDANDQNGDAFEATFQELMNSNVTLCCGNPYAFVQLCAKKYHARKVKAVIHEENGQKKIGAIFFIKIQTEQTAMKIEAYADVKFEGECDEGAYPSLKGYMMFEDE